MTDFHVMIGAGETLARPAIRRIGTADVTDALRRGFDDFWERPSHYVFLCLIYPIAGIILGTWASGYNALPLVFPLISGFALLGPLAAIGLYEISRRREQGLDTSWRHAFDVRHSPALPSILLVGFMLLVFFVVWLLVAQTLYVHIFGPMPPQSVSGFLHTVLTTERGWTLIIAGNAIGFLFAVLVLLTSVIAFPLLLDRDVGAASAVETSARAVIANPVPLAAWGLIDAALLVIGSVTLIAGLAVEVPVLGHATWHLDRKLVVREGS
jgi:uncharacterized membrane protein